MRDQFIEAHRQMTPWGFKDPRTVFTIEGWLEAVPDLRLVGTFRHPVPVARSLQRRGGRELGGWIDLWYLYNERLLKLRDRHSFDLVNFDPALRSDDEVESGEVTLPPAAAALYEELLARSM